MRTETDSVQEPQEPSVTYSSKNVPPLLHKIVEHSLNCHQKEAKKIVPLEQGDFRKEVNAFFAKFSKQLSHLPSDKARLLLGEAEYWVDILRATLHPEQRPAKKSSILTGIVQKFINPS